MFTCRSHSRHAKCLICHALPSASVHSSASMISSQAQHLGFNVSAWCLPQYSLPSLQKYIRSTSSCLHTQQTKQAGCQRADGPARLAATAISPAAIGLLHSRHPAPWGLSSWLACPRPSASRFRCAANTLSSRFSSSVSPLQYRASLSCGGSCCSSCFTRSRSPALPAYGILSSGSALKYRCTCDTWREKMVIKSNML